MGNGERFHATTHTQYYSHNNHWRRTNSDSDIGPYVVAYTSHPILATPQITKAPTNIGGCVV